MKYIVGLLLCALSVSAYCWETTSGKITDISLYAGKDIVLVRLDNPGISNADCTDTSSFAVSGDITEARRSTIVSALFMAKATGQNISIAYYKSGSCATYKEGSTFRTIQRLML
ncbi:hypothetical protein [Teredinibacter turnerae]|uniref:hypothetical protein n=1 Tax=Teredinibacter turnerae TaxID=2426 RepID=UPI0012F8F2E8|nr:hypothetical protein [Teredinibacter turnerae]